MSSQPPEPFLEHPGQPPIDWDNWKKKWYIYAKLRTIQISHLNLRVDPAKIGDRDSAQQAATYSNEEQNMELIQTLGSEGQRLFSGTEDFDDYSRNPSTVIKSCDKIFHSEKKLSNCRISISFSYSKKRRISQRMVSQT